MGTREDDLNELERLARELATARAAREQAEKDAEEWRDCSRDWRTRAETAEDERRTLRGERDECKDAREQAEKDLAELRATCRALAEDRDAKTEELRLMRPVIEAGAAIPVDNLIALTERNGRRMSRWASAELARRNGKVV